MRGGRTHTIPFLIELLYMCVTAHTILIMVCINASKPHIGRHCDCEPPGQQGVTGNGDALFVSINLPKKQSCEATDKRFCENLGPRFVLLNFG